MSPNKELIKLVSLLMDDIITDAQQIRLQEMLTSSRENRVAFLELTQLESLLHWEKSNETLDQMASEVSSTLIRFPMFAWASSLAASLVALMGALWLFKESFISRYSFDQGKNLVAVSSPQSQDQISHVTSSNALKQDALQNFQLLDPYELSSTTTLNGLRALTGKKHDFKLGVVEHFGLIDRWNRIPKMSTPAQSGILPAEGNDMIALQELFIDVDASTGRSIETVQVLDVRTALKKREHAQAQITASAKFNQSFGESQEGAEFGLSMQGFREQGEDFIATTEVVYVNTIGDLDVRTWDTLSSEIELSEGTEFVVISLITSKQGPDALLANTCRYFSDDLEVTLLLNKQSALGPI
jgi:hypothetical protein